MSAIIFGKGFISHLTKTLNWEQVKDSKDFRENYVGNVHHDIVGHRMEYKT